MMINGLFDDFEQSDVAAILRSRQSELQADGVARAIKTTNRTKLRRANSEATLAELLPVRFQPGESYHVISRGDVDALSYLSHAINGVSHFDFVGISTWCIARPDLEQIAAWLDAGRIEHFELYAGEIFPSQYGDEHEQMLKMVADYDCKLVIAKNHSKVTLASNYADDYHLVVEGSANVNTNPRIEQAAIHCGRELFDFYREFFNGLRSIDRSTKSH